MNLLLDIAEQLFVDRMIGNKAPITGESKLKFILVTLSGLFGLGGLGLCLYAFYLWLDVNYSLPITMAILGGTMILLSILFALSVIAIMRYKQKKLKEIRNELIEVMESTLKLVEKEISEPVNDNPKTSVLLSSIAGYLAGDRFL